MMFKWNIYKQMNTRNSFIYKAVQIQRICDITFDRKYAK